MSECPNLYTTRKGDTACRLHDKDLAELRQQVAQKDFRLERAKEVYSDMKKQVAAGDRYQVALVDLDRKLKNMRVARGASVEALRRQVDECREIIKDALA